GAEPRHLYAAPGRGRQRESVARARGVGLDAVGLRAVAARALPPKAVSLRLDPSTEARHHAPGDLDIAAADQLALHLEHRFTLGGRAGGQQRREVLARAITAHGDPAARQPTAVHCQRRAARLAIDANPELSQAFDQVPDRALGHGLVANERDRAVYQAGERG